MVLKSDPTTWRRLRREARKKGWKIVEQRNGTHERWHTPDGNYVVTVGDHTALAPEFKQRLRKNGLTI